MTLKSIEAEVEKEFEGVLDKWQNGGLTFTAKAWLRTQLRRVALEVVREVSLPRMDGEAFVDSPKANWQNGWNEARQAMQERADALIGDETV